MSRLLPRRLPIRLHAPSTLRFSSSFGQRPAPPKLPAEQQAEFERLQRAASVSAAFQPQEPAPPTTQQPRHTTEPGAAAATVETAAAPRVSDVNQGMFRGAPPEFEGDVNPKTGEVGGPKNEPLRWGGQSDWSYNGRATDF